VLALPLLNALLAPLRTRAPPVQPSRRPVPRGQRRLSGGQLLLLHSLEHGHVGGGVLECADDGFLDGELLDGVGGVGGEAELGDLARVAGLGVRVGLLRAEFVLHDDRPEVLLVRGLDVDQQPRPPAVVRARLVMRRRLRLLRAAPRVVAGLPIAEALLRGWLGLLLPLIREALVVLGLQLGVERLDLGQRHAGHHLQLPRVYHTHLRVPPREGNDRTRQVELVDLQKALFLDAEVREELGVAP